MENLTADQVIMPLYRAMVAKKYPHRLLTWPLLKSYNIKNGEFGEYIILILEDTKGSPIKVAQVLYFDNHIVGYSEINNSNVESVRNNLRANLCLSPSEAVIILRKNTANVVYECERLLLYHEIKLGVVKMKIFLSHKSTDKTKVRMFKSALATLGFDVWIDEDSMPAGTKLHRGIRDGFKESCAVVFFITPNFKDVGALESEIDYAIEEKTAKGNMFSIITLLFSENGSFGEVPDLLRSYVWKQPANDLVALEEIIKALPIKLGSPTYK